MREKESYRGSSRERKKERGTEAKGEREREWCELITINVVVRVSHVRG